MKAFVLAAGRGERMRPLTNNIPKPLVPLNGRPLIEYQLEKLEKAGIRDVIINVAYLGEKIVGHLENTNLFNLNIVFSYESEPLETGGALNHALALIGDDDILLVNGDVWSEIDYSKVIENARECACVAQGGGHLVLVENPSFKDEGDFSLEGFKLKSYNASEAGFTFSGVSVLSASLLNTFPNKREKFQLKEILDWGIEKDIISAEVTTAYWNDVGTPGRLKEVEDFIGQPQHRERENLKTP